MRGVGSPCNADDTTLVRMDYRLGITRVLAWKHPNRFHSSTQSGETMKFQASVALSSSVYWAAFIAPAAFAAPGHSDGAGAQAERSTRSSMLYVVTGVRGGQPIQSSPLDLLKVNTVEGASMGAVRVPVARPLQDFAPAPAPAATDAQPGTLAMLLTGLGVMGSIARRRRLAKKAA